MTNNSTVMIQRRDVDLDSTESLIRRLEEVVVNIPTAVKNMWKTETKQSTDPSLSVFIKTSQRTQKICFSQCIFANHLYTSKPASFWKSLGTKKCRYSRSSSRKKAEHFWALVLSYPTLFKLDNKIQPDSGGTIPWNVNDTCRLMHLFLEPDLQESISRIYEGL